MTFVIICIFLEMIHLTDRVFFSGNDVPYWLAWFSQKWPTSLTGMILPGNDPHYRLRISQKRPALLTVFSQKWPALLIVYFLRNDPPYWLCILTEMTRFIDCAFFQIWRTRLTHCVFSQKWPALLIVYFLRNDPPNWLCIFPYRQFIFPETIRLINCVFPWNVPLYGLYFPRNDPFYWLYFPRNAPLYWLCIFQKWSILLTIFPEKMHLIGCNFHEMTLSADFLGCDLPLPLASAEYFPTACIKKNPTSVSIAYSADRFPIRRVFLRK